MLGRLLRRASICLAAVVALLVVPTAAAAHGGASPSLVVTVDHVDPGSSVPIIAADFGTDSRVVFDLVAPARSLELGQWNAGAVGHLNKSLDVPADYPVGWADLVATGDDGSSTSAQVLIGPVAGAPSRPNRSATWWQDPATLLLAGLLLAGGLALAALVVRSARKTRPKTRRSTLP